MAGGVALLTTADDGILDRYLRWCAEGEGDLRQVATFLTMSSQRNVAQLELRYSLRGLPGATCPRELTLQ